MNILLKFAIIERFKTQRNFARKCGRNDNWISRIVTGQQLLTNDEKKMICEKLNIKDIEPYLKFRTS
jgi:cyanate lyase